MARIVAVFLLAAAILWARGVIPAADTARSAVSAAASSAVATSTAAREATSTLDMFRVVRVVDGDTFVVDERGVQVTLRLIGIDTPEVVDPRKVVQCFGMEASAEAHRLLDGQSVRLEYDSSQGILDKYGRTLAYAYLPDGRMFNKTMIDEGFAHEYTYSLPYRYQTEFKDAERRAREGALGLWSPDTCAGNTKQSAQ